MTLPVVLHLHIRLDSMGSSQECQAEACAIQACLTKRAYDEAKCAAQVEALYRCCARLYDAASAAGKSTDEAKSTACPLERVVRRKMRQFEA
ncbi:hypothetical protein Q5752_004402 [Cryptotrichosporon argae]